MLRVLWWVRWAAGAPEAELRAIASAGDDVHRLVRAARFDACVTTWHQARLAMSGVVRLGEIVPSADAILRGAARQILCTPNIPPPPQHAYAAPEGERPPLDLDPPQTDPDQARSATDLPAGAPPRTDALPEPDGDTVSPTG